MSSGSLPVVVAFTAFILVIITPVTPSRYVRRSERNGTKKVIVPLVRVKDSIRELLDL
jgi:hypothetical protein